MNLYFLWQLFCDTYHGSRCQVEAFGPLLIQCPGWQFPPAGYLDYRDVQGTARHIARGQGRSQSQSVQERQHFKRVKMEV